MTERMTIPRTVGAERPLGFAPNWMRDPDAEVSDGYLSNMAGEWAAERRELEWQPRFHAYRHRYVSCPECGLEMRQLESRWGAFFRCRCGAKVSFGTKVYRARLRFLGFCGERLVATVNNMGVPYAGCPACDPSIGERHQAPIGDFMAGRGAWR